MYKIKCYSDQSFRLVLLKILRLFYFIFWFQVYLVVQDVKLLSRFTELCTGILMVWYGMVNVDVYSAIITKVSNAV